MLHIVAYVVIGVVVGYFVGQGNQRGLVPTIVLSLVGAFGGGLILHASKYGSIGVAIVAAIILAYVGKAIFKPKNA